QGSPKLVRHDRDQLRFHLVDPPERHAGFLELDRLLLELRVRADPVDRETDLIGEEEQRPAPARTRLERPVEAQERYAQERGTHDDRYPDESVGHPPAPMELLPIGGLHAERVLDDERLPSQHLREKATGTRRDPARSRGPVRAVLEVIP